MIPASDRDAANAVDDDLVASLRAGDQGAFEAVYGSYHAGIYNLCARIVCDREEAQDLAQDVFVTAFRRLPEMQGELRLRPWLYRVATNACLNHLRSRRHRDPGDPAVLDRVAAPIDEFERAQTVGLVEESLAELNDRYRTALVLKDLQGLPSDEIAAVMDVSRANADVLVHRARASFRRAFAGLAGDGAPAPASLAAVLAPLAVPAALHAMPALVSNAAVAAGASAAAVAGSGSGAVTGSAVAHVAGHAGSHLGAGLVSKLGASLTAKVIIGAAAVTVIVGGGIAVDRYEAARSNSHHPSSPPAATVPVSTVGTPARTTISARSGSGDCHGWTRWAGHGAAHDGYSYRCSDHHGVWASSTTWAAQDADDTSGGHEGDHSAGTTSHDSGGSDTHAGTSGTLSGDHTSSDTTTSGDHMTSGSGDSHMDSAGD